MRVVKLTTYPRALGAALLYTFAFVSCGGDSSPVAPSPVSPAPPPVATTVSLSGSVTAIGGARLAGATVAALDGPNSGRTVQTDSSGNFRFDALQAGNTNFSASAAGYEEQRRGMSVTGSGQTLAFTLRTIQPWTQNGSGNTVFDKPAYVTRVRITGRYDGTGSNFVIWCGSSLLVNEILGTRWPSTQYDGTHATPNCTQVQVTNSTGVQWSMMEVR